MFGLQNDKVPFSWVWRKVEIMRTAKRNLQRNVTELTAHRDVCDQMFKSFLAAKYGNSANSKAEGNGSVGQNTDSTFVLRID
jgi:hypothetical protein